MTNSANRYFQGLFIGSTLGFVLGLLTAPKPGSELRRALTSGGTDGADLLNNFMGNNSGPMYTAGNKVNPDTGVSMKT